MFLGTHTPRLDDKGRLFLPAKFRDELSEGLVVTRGQERCLYVWPSAEFRSFTEQLRKAPVTNKSARNFMRMLFAGASAETADKQGRVTLPPMLREYAGLTRECVVIGAFNRVEIWDSEAWNSYLLAVAAFALHRPDAREICRNGMVRLYEFRFWVMYWPVRSGCGLFPTARHSPMNTGTPFETKLVFALAFSPSI